MVQSWGTEQRDLSDSLRDVPALTRTAALRYRSITLVAIALCTTTQGTTDSRYRRDNNARGASCQLLSKPPELLAKDARRLAELP